MRRLRPHRAGIRRLASAVLAAGVSLASCRDKPAEERPAYERIMSFDTATVLLLSGYETTRVVSQLAVSPQQKSMGLMERLELAADHGMVFVYDSAQGATAGFWMYRTRIPLDIGFYDASGVLRAIRAMVPCPTTLPEGCPVYQPGVPYQYALEVNPGFFARHHLEVGSRLVLGDIVTGVGSASSSRAPAPR